MKLELMKMGCDINEKIKGVDLSNHRYRVRDLELKQPVKVVKHDKTYYINKIDTLELTCGAIRTKKGETLYDKGLWVDTEYKTDFGSYRLLDLESKLNEHNFGTRASRFNKKTLLKVINSISKTQYRGISEVKYYE